MMKNRAIWKALHSLTHPLSIAAILLLLFNDHWLRHTYPSILTGKLGDFTWLLFAPFIAALLFAFLIPQKLEKYTNYVGIASIAFIGIWFATAKTVPFVHWLTTETLYAIVGYRGTLRMDVTDLLTLPALLITWHIWQNAPETKLNLKPIAYVAFGLGMLGTMASDSVTFYNTAIERICETDDARLITGSRYSYTGSFNEASPSNDAYTPTTVYMSENGGLTWYITDYDYSLVADTCMVNNTSVIDPNNENIQYRWVKGEYIEQSSDSGITWTRIHDLPELKQDVREYGNHEAPDHLSPDPIYRSSPVSGLVHTETGNLVLAMSSDGVLVITPDGESHWATVGEFQLDNLQDQTFLGKAFAVQYLLLPTLWCLIFVSVIVLTHAKLWTTRIWFGMGWFNWVFLVVAAHSVRITGTGGPSDSTSNIAQAWTLVALSSLILIALPMILWSLVVLFSHYRRVIVFVSVFFTALLASLAYLLPLILWTQGMIPRYYVAAIFSVFLMSCVLWACYQYYKDKLPDRYEAPKEKRKPKEI